MIGLHILNTNILGDVMQHEEWRWGNDLWSNNASSDLGNSTWNPNMEGFDWGNDLVDDKLNNLGKGTEIGWNTGTLEGAGSILGGIGSLAQAWAGLQGVKLGKERLAMQDQQFGANFTNQATLLNNQVDKHNTWAAANRNSTTYDNIGTDYKNIG